MAVEHELVIIIAVSKCTKGSMSPRDMSVFAGGRRVNLNLFATCICYIVATSSVETTSRRFVFAGNSFSDLLRIQSS